MKNIALVRIDDRLIHGQVMTQWVRFRHFNTILIIDDATAGDDFLAEIAVAAAPGEFKTMVYSVDKAAEYLLGEPAEEIILILVKYVDTIERLVEKGVLISELNVGGIGMKRGREKVFRNIAVSQAERDTFGRLMKGGMKIYVQIVPTDVSMDIEKIL